MASLFEATFLGWFLKGNRKDPNRFGGSDCYTVSSQTLQTRQQFLLELTRPGSAWREVSFQVTTWRLKGNQKETNALRTIPVLKRTPKGKPPFFVRNTKCSGNPWFPKAHDPNAGPGVSPSKLGGFEWLGFDPTWFLWGPEPPNHPAADQSTLPFLTNVANRTSKYISFCPAALKPLKSSFSCGPDLVNPKTCPHAELPDFTVFEKTILVLHKKFRLSLHDLRDRQ